MIIKNVLVVCVGNICRSPIAERLLASKCPRISVRSSGLGAMVGHSADQQAIESAKRGGFIMGQHISRQFSVQEARESDLILVMELGHAAKIREAAPELSGKCFLFGHWQDELEIADPYRKSDEFHDAVFARIKTAASTWAGKIGGGTDE